MSPQPKGPTDLHHCTLSTVHKLSETTWVKRLKHKCAQPCLAAILKISVVPSFTYTRKYFSLMMSWNSGCWCKSNNNITYKTLYSAMILIVFMPWLSFCWWTTPSSRPVKHKLDWFITPAFVKELWSNYDPSYDPT